MAAYAPFHPAARRFFRRLARTNTRAWFEAHRPEYEAHVRGPLKAFVEEMDVRLARVAPELVGDPRRSVFRIHRDIRFSKDKSPYKTNAGCWFYHRDAGKGVGQESDGGGAGVYFHFDARECFVAGGIWMPGRPTLAKLRDALAEDPAGFGRILRAPGFRRRFGRLDEDAMLTRLPRGFAPGHPAEAWLRFQSFTVHRPLPGSAFTSPRLPAMLERDIVVMRPFLRWLNVALGYRAAEKRL